MQQSESRRSGGRRRAWSLLAIAAAFAAQNVGAAPAAPEPRLFVQGTEIVLSIDDRLVIEQDRLQPGLAVLTLAGGMGRAFASGVKLGVPVSLTAPALPASALFTGEVVAVEGCDGSDTVTLRVVNRLHRLAGAVRTRTFFGATDAEIAATVAAEHGLSALVGNGVTERHESVSQHNQTDLEFLRARAARNGFEVWVEGTTLIVGRRRDGASIRPRTFLPRLSSSVTVQTVVVRGWDPVQRIEIVGRAAAPAVLLGEAGDPTFGGTEEFTADHPIFSVEEASALATSTLEELTVERNLSEAEMAGSVALVVGQPVTVEGSGARFGGRYLVQGVTHRYGPLPDGGSGYRTLLKVSRQDLASFVLPEVDDEVLVAFEHGDLRRPYVVGSLWDGGDAPPCSTDRPRPD